MQHMPDLAQNLRNINRGFVKVNPDFYAPHYPSQLDQVMDKVPKPPPLFPLLQDQFYIEYSAIRIFSTSIVFCLLQENEQNFLTRKRFYDSHFSLK
jgi:hypothetical protein